MILLPVRGQWRITQGFGENLLPLYRSIGMLGHNGVDFVSTDRTIYAPHEGYVTLKRKKTGYGNHIELTSLPYDDEKRRRYSVLGHLESFLVKDGQFVHAGEPVGIMGTTGTSTGVHLHMTYKVLQNGKTLDSNNGYSGAIDFLPHTVVWYPTITQAVPRLASQGIWKTVSRLVDRLVSRASQNAKE
jgi:murein DD-endopeptidase MepM/ murein hydrolase activator NlpD